LTTHRISRRQWLRQAAGFAAAFPLASAPLEAALAARVLRNAPGKNDPGKAYLNLFPADPTRYRFTLDEDALLENIERTSFQYFWEQAHPETGLVKDRNLAAAPDERNVASIAATGFGLTALCIAHQRAWQDPLQILQRVKNTLRFACTRLPHQRGFLWHFMNMANGQRAFQSEVSSIDTAIFLCGALACRGYFDDHEIQDLASRLYQRADWNWLVRNEKTIAMGWTPESGFLRSRWDSYSELMMLPLLALGSPTHALTPEVWDAWSRPNFEFDGIRYVGAHAPLFVHQYSHAWFDFRNVRDRHADYFTNSIIATKVHKLWCLELAAQFPDYTEDLWGVTSSDSPRGYTAWGGPPPMGHIDGSIVPCAAGGSLPFMPEETIRVLQTVREKYGSRAWQRYGYVDAFNPLTNWYSQDVLGIDAGITLLMAENARSGFVWDHFMKNPEVQRGMSQAGFHPVESADAHPRPVPEFKSVSTTRN
jgi:hypothetical protein